MRRARRWFRRIAAVLATVAIGAMLGYLVPTVIADYTPKPQVQAAVAAESPLARAFIRAYIADDQVALTELGISDDIKLKATSFRSNLASIDPPTHLGSFVAGGFSLHSYAAHAKQQDGTDVFLSWRVLTGGGGVLIVDPPQPANINP
jgi:hypothetical protein